MSTTKKITIRATGAGCAKFGPCEVCGKSDGAEVYIGKALVEYKPGRFTYAGGIGHTFGHYDCLRELLNA